MTREFSSLVVLALLFGHGTIVALAGNENIRDLLDFLSGERLKNRSSKNTKVCGKEFSEIFESCRNDLLQKHPELKQVNIYNCFAWAQRHPTIPITH